MSFVDLDKLSPVDLIVHYVLECRASGLFLPYQDYQIVEEWLAISKDADDLLLILSDVLPAYFDHDVAPDSSVKRSQARGLGGVRRLVLSRIKDRAMRG